MTADIINIIDKKPNSIPKKINRKEIEVPTDTLNKYTGRFALEADLSQIFIVRLEESNLIVMDSDGEKTKIFPDSDTTFFDDPKSKDGSVFNLNPLTNKYDLVVISTGLKLKTNRLE